jgi:platelet-activating factor acetylhydrolase
MLGVSAFILWPVFLLYGSRIQVNFHRNPVMSPQSQSNLQVPALPNASPLRKSASLDSASTDQPTPHESPWPLVIFSHGLGGGGTTYRFRARASIVCFDNCSYLDNSQLCTHLASSGKVVIAMEHRDGTGPICRPRSEATGEIASQLYISPSEVV